MSKELDKRIEEIRKLITRGLVQRDVDNDILVGVGVYYRDEAERILQSLLDEQKKEIVERMKDYVANAPLGVKLSKIPYDIINSITKDN